MLTPPATPRRVAPREASLLLRPKVAAAVLLAGTVATGLMLGVMAALADGRGGALSDLLSVPGPWIAGAAAVAVAASRNGRAWTGPVATAGFLLSGIAAYYVVKHSAMGAAPGPLVVFWGVLGVAVGAVGGTAAAWCVARPWGIVAVAGAVAGWLVVEAVVLPAAPSAEAVAGLIGVGFVGRGTGPRVARWRAATVGFGLGAAAAIGVFAVLGHALSAAL